MIYQIREVFKMKKLVALFLAIFLIGSTAAVVGCGGSKITIYVDGGGQQGAYNSTASMQYDPVANPYPYNTLEQLADQYNESHPDVEIVINRTSLNNDREKLVSQLTQQRAPDILFYLPSGLAEDMNKGWFVPLNEYYEQPNPYCKEGEKGSEHWKDIYDASELAGYYAPNGQIFSAPIDKAPIGIIYNKDLFEKAGITETPEYFSELLDAQEKLQNYFTSIGKNNDQSNPPEDAMTPYFPLYYWYDILLESAIYCNSIEEMDYLVKDGRVDTEEVLRAAKKPSEDDPLFWIAKVNDDDTWSYSEEYEAYLDLILELAKYYPSGYEGYYAESEFVQGRVGMLEANSGQMMKISKDEQKDFEIGTFPYPKLDESITINGKTYNVNPGGYYTKRGLAGLTTGWVVTNSAIKKGDAAVEAAVDFLMFVTAPENNDKMVNDLGFSVPLSGNTTNELYKSLVANYEEDANNEKAMAWGAFNSWGCLGKAYLDTFLNGRKALIGKKFDSNFNRYDAIHTMMQDLTKGFANAELKLMRENEFDTSRW